MKLTITAILALAAGILAMPTPLLAPRNGGEAPAGTCTFSSNEKLNLGHNQELKENLKKMPDRPISSGGRSLANYLVSKVAGSKPNRSQRVKDF